jgi:hypothetical protein
MAAEQLSCRRERAVAVEDSEVQVACPAAQSPEPPPMGGSARGRARRGVVQTRSLSSLRPPVNPGVVGAQAG